MTDRFKQYLTGKLPVDVEGEEPLELDMELQEKRKILVLSQKMQKEPEQEKAMGELNEILKVILRRSYPKEELPDNAMDAYLLRNSEALLMGLAVAFKWMTKSQLNKMKDDFESPDKKKELKKISEES